VFSNDAETDDLFSQDYCGAFSYTIEGFPREDLLYADQLPETPLDFTALTLTLESLEDVQLVGTHEVTLMVSQNDFPEIAAVAFKFNLIVDGCYLDVFETVFHGTTLFNYKIGSKETLVTSQITTVQEPLCEGVARLVVEPEVEWFTPNADGSFSIMTDDYSLAG